ncbi:hypothetical protein M758_UG168200 [Ceratodon purpureus]|nr:hypothetical protein M758_UG168200 [Ceratodon purpureus]
MVIINLCLIKGHQRLLHQNAKFIYSRSFYPKYFRSKYSKSFCCSQCWWATASPPHPHGVASESQTNTLRRIIRNLESQVNDLRANNRLLQALVNNQVNENPIPDVAKWEFIKPHMKKNF